jgi:hypothetical protein
MSDADLDLLYAEFWKLIDKSLVDHSPEAIAGVMIAQAMTIYRSIMTDVDYDRIIDSISDSRDSVRKLEGPSLQ